MSRAPVENALGPGPIAGKEHVRYAIDTLICHFSGEPLGEPKFSNHHCPLFVTWMKTSSRGDSRLRGCIGTLEPRHIHSAIKDYSLTSALRDRRFAPIQWKEIASLECTVSLLTNFESAAHCLDWVVGVHGVILEFIDPQGQSRSATYLPEIAEREGWSQEEAVDSLMRKAGYDGAITQALRAASRLVRYQSSPYTMSYAEYAQGR